MKMHKGWEEAPCTNCKQVRKIYWAYFFGGKCKECIDAELAALPQRIADNPFIALVDKD